MYECVFFGVKYPIFWLDFIHRLLIADRRYSATARQLNIHKTYETNGVWIRFRPKHEDVESETDIFFTYF